MKEYIINKTNENQRLDKYIKRILPSASNAFIYKMLRKKNIELNQKRAKGDEMLKNGDSVRFFLSDDTFLKMSSSNKPIGDEYTEAYKTLKGIEVVFDHEDFMILNKPSGILSQKDEKNRLSLNEWAVGYLLERNIVTQDSLKEFTPSIVNRLDRNTKGLIMVGKTLTGSRRLSEMIKKRQIKKYYIASTKGNCTLSGVYKAYLYKDTSKNKVYIYDDVKDIPDGCKYSYIETGIEVIESNNEVSLLEIDLLTGKSHQIRAHLSHLGFPLNGDYKYNEDEKNKGKYQDLCAYKIVFPKFPESDDWHSLSGKIIKC